MKFSTILISLIAPLLAMAVPVPEPAVTVAEPVLAERQYTATPCGWGKRDVDGRDVEC